MDRETIRQKIADIIKHHLGVQKIKLYSSLEKEYWMTEELCQLIQADILQEFNVWVESCFFENLNCVAAIVEEELQTK